MKSMFVAALFASLASTAALAEPKLPSAPTSELTAPAAPAPSRAVRYCYQGELTGSRILRRECRTAAEWKDLGIVVPQVR